MRDDVTFSEYFERYLEKAIKPEDEKSFLRTHLRSLLNPFAHYSFQSLVLAQGMDVSAVCRIFETLNNTGVRLDSFDICVAKYMAEDKNLDIKSKLDEVIDNNPTLSALFLKDITTRDSYKNREMILQTIALKTPNTDHKKNALATSLKANIVKGNWDVAVNALKETVKILNNDASTESSTDLLPYSVIVPVIAAALIEANYFEMSELDKVSVKKIIVDYFYYTAFNERYADGAPGKMKKDKDALVQWISSGQMPDSPELFSCKIEWKYDKFKQIRKNDKGAIALALRCVLYRKNPLDFYNNSVVELNVTNLHHIFPDHRYKAIFGDGVDSIFNLSYLDKSTNGSIGDDPVQVYTDKIIKKRGEEPFKDILKTHLISGDTYEYLRNEDYENFIKSRAKEIFEAIKNSLGLNIVDVTGTNTENDDVPKDMPL